MTRKTSNAVIDALFEGRILEAQGIHVVSYKARGIKYGMTVVNTADYNKLKKSPGFTEVDHYEIEKNDNPKRFFAQMEEDIASYGLPVDGFAPSDDGDVHGKPGALGRGYVIYDTSSLKVKKYGVID